MVQRFRRRITGLAIAAIAGSFAPAAIAAPATRLVSCGSESCLLVTGRRDSTDAPVAINGNPVAVEGQRNWRVRLPLATVRAWSAPFARSVDVTVGETDSTAEASLPIGLLGHRVDLAALVVRAR